MNCPGGWFVCALVFLAVVGCAHPKARHAAGPTSAPTSSVTTAPAVASLRSSPGPYRPMPLRVLKVDERSITVRPRFAVQNQPPPGDQTLVIDPQQTQVFAHVITNERVTDGGQVVMSTKFRPASISELKVGQQVHIGTNDHGVAVDIIIMPMPTTRLGTRATTRRGVRTRYRPTTTTTQRATER